MQAHWLIELGRYCRSDCKNLWFEEYIYCKLNSSCRPPPPDCSALNYNRPSSTAWLLCIELQPPLLTTSQPPIFMHPCVVGKMKVQVCHIGMTTILDNFQGGQVRLIILQIVNERLFLRWENLSWNIMKILLQGLTFYFRNGKTTSTLIQFEVEPQFNLKLNNKR